MLLPMTKVKKAGPEQAEDLRPFWRQQTEEVSTYKL